MRCFDWFNDRLWADFGPLRAEERALIGFPKLVTALAAIHVTAVPPPPPQDPELLALATTTCPIDVTASAQPYSPEIYHFNGNTDDTLLVVNGEPDLNLNFTLGIVGEAPLITGAGFGAEVRVRLPHTGTYQLQISSFDPVHMRALAADFKLKLALRGEVIPQDC